MPGFSSDTVGGGGTLYATNVDFTGNSFTKGSPQMVADGQLLIGSAVNPRIRVGTLGSSDSSITWTVGHGTITGQVTGGSTVGKTITGNSGGPLAPNLGNWNIITSGSTVKFAGSLSTLTQNFAITNLALGSSLASLSSGANNVSFGNGSMAAITSGGSNTIIGDTAAPSLTTGNNNIIIGASALTLATNSNNSVVIGNGALNAYTSNTNANNVVIGYTAGGTLTTGTNNILLGVSVGTNYTSSESSDILIGNGGVVGESNVIRIGTNGSAVGQQNKCFIAAITGTTVAGSAPVGVNSSGQLSSLGFGSSGQLLQSNGAASSPTYTTATYPSTTTINQILYSSTANTVSGITAGNQSVLTSSTTGVPSWTSIATNGQLIIGSTAGNPAAATLTAGTGVSITNGSNSITINAIGGGLTWNDVTGTSATIAVNNGYLADNAGLVTLTLPSTATQFSAIAVAGIGAGGWTIAQNANQKIIFGTKTTTTGVGGSLSSTNANDCLHLLATVGGASTTWTVLNSVGNITVV